VDEVLPYLFELTEDEAAVVADISELKILIGRYVHDRKLLGSSQPVAGMCFIVIAGL